MEGKIKTFTYLDLEVHAYTNIYAWLLIKELCEKQGIAVPVLKEVQVKKKVKANRETKIKRKVDEDFGHTFTYLDIEVRAFTKGFAQTLINSHCSLRGIKAPKLNEIKLKKN